MAKLRGNAWSMTAGPDSEPEPHLNGRLPSRELQRGVERLRSHDHDSARLHAYAVHVTESLLRLREICRPDAQSRQIILPSGRIGCSLTEELLNSILQDDLNPAVLHDERDCTRSLNIF
jgi:hypothetical protein